MSTGYMCLCFCCFAFRWALPLSVLVSLPSSPPPWLSEYVSRISKFKWKCYYKVCWARRLKAEHWALTMLWSLPLHCLFKLKIANISLAENMFSPSPNMSHSSRGTLLGLFPELSFRSTDGKLDCKTSGFIWSPEGAGGRFSLSGTNGWTLDGSALFSAASNHAVQTASETGNWIGWFVCSSIANSASLYRNV